MTPVKPFLVVPAILFTLISCGGEVDEQASEEAASKTEISKAEFDSIVTKTGTWYSVINSNSELVTNIFNALNVDVDFNLNSSFPTFVEYSDQAEVAWGECAAALPEVLSEAVFQAQSNVADLFCMDGLQEEQRYFKIAEDHYRIEYICDGENAGSWDVERISETPEFSNGLVEFVSDQFPDLQASVSNSCGNLLEFAGKAKLSDLGFDDQDYAYSAVSVAAVYGAYRVAFDFSFNGEFKLQDYDVVNDYDLRTSNPFVTVDVVSQAFGGSEDNPAKLVASSGTVTLTHIDDQSVTGEFSIVTDTGANFNGDFSFSYK